MGNTQTTKEASITRTCRSLKQMTSIVNIDLKKIRDTWCVSIVMFMLMGWDNVSELRPPMGLLLIPQVTCEYREPRWHDTDTENQRTQIKPVPVPLCLPQIPHGLTRAWTQASIFRCRRLTTWAMAWRKYCHGGCTEATLAWHTNTLSVLMF
jgi:hypothetical protein